MHRARTIKPFALVGSGYDDPDLYPIRPTKGGTGYAFRNERAWLDGLDYLRSQKLKVLYEQAEALTKQVDFWEGDGSRRWYEEQYSRMDERSSSPRADSPSEARTYSRKASSEQ